MIAKATVESDQIEEAGRQQQVRAQARHGEAGAREERDENAGERHRRLEDEQQLRPVVLRSERRIREEQCEAGREQSGQDDLAPQPRLQLGALPSHIGSCRQKGSCR